MDLWFIFVSQIQYFVIGAMWCVIDRNGRQESERQNVTGTTEACSSRRLSLLRNHWMHDLCKISVHSCIMI